MFQERSVEDPYQEISVEDASPCHGITVTGKGKDSHSHSSRKNSSPSPEIAIPITSPLPSPEISPASAGNNKPDDEDHFPHITVTYDESDSSVIVEASFMTCSFFSSWGKERNNKANPPPPESWAEIHKLRNR